MTKNIPVLIPTAIKNNIKNSRYLGVWCNKYEKQKKNKFIKYHWNELKKIQRDVVILEKYFEKLLGILNLQLNDLHEKKNLSYWRILIGPWLYFYISTLYDRWEILNSFFKKNRGKYVFYDIEDNEVSYDTLEFLEHARKSDKFNYSLFGRIIKYQYQSRVKIRSKATVLFYENNLKKENLKNKNIFLTLIAKVTNYLSLNFNNIILDIPNIPLKDYLIICSRLRIFPSLNLNYFLTERKNIKVNYDLRKKLSLKIDKKDSFLEFLLNNIIKDLPKVFLEDFKSTNLLNKNLNKKNKKLIITSSNYLVNERFKFWIAQMKFKKAKICVYRHGGFIDQDARDMYTFHHLEKISNKYLDWNKKKFSSKRDILPPIQLLKFKNLKLKKNREKCLIVEPSIFIYNIKCSPFPYNENIEKNFIFTEKFINKLNKKIQSKIVLRILKTDGRDYLKDNLKKKFDRIEICDLKDSFKKRISESKVVICKYLDTPISEVLFSDIPFIILIPKDFYLKKGFEKIFKDLKKNKILFENPLEASNHLNKYWDKIYSWWDDKNTTICRNKLKNEVGILNKNFLKDTVSKVRGLA